MTQDKTLNLKLARLEHVLETYGARASRWPAADRDELEALLAARPEAHRLFAESEALAKVMEAAPAMIASDALKARIVAAAVRAPERDARVVPIDAARHAPSGDVSRPGAVWPAAALAASFALGLYLGIAGVGGQTVASAVQISGLSGSASDLDGMSWLDETIGPESEDVL